jgi:hypothetical protein
MSREDLQKGVASHGLCCFVDFDGRKGGVEVEKNFVPRESKQMKEQPRSFRSMTHATS